MGAARGRHPAPARLDHARLTGGPAGRRASRARSALAYGGTSRPTAGRYARGMSAAVQVPGARVALSTASVYPEAAPPRSSWPRGSATTASRSWSGPTRSARTPVRCGRWPTTTACRSCRVHAPTPADHPAGLGHRPVGQARPVAASWRTSVGAGTVVRAPAVPLAARVRRGLRRRGGRCASTTPTSRFAVENMFPWRARGREMLGLPAALGPGRARLRQRHARPVAHRHRRVRRAGRWRTRSGDRLAHVHLADGSGSSRGRAPGARPRHAAVRRAAGTPGRSRRSTGIRRGRGQHPQHGRRTQREADLAEALAFARLNLAAAPA